MDKVVSYGAVQVLLTWLFKKSPDVLHLLVRILPQSAPRLLNGLVSQSRSSFDRHGWIATLVSAASAALKAVVKLFLYQGETNPEISDNLDNRDLSLATEHSHQLW